MAIINLNTQQASLKKTLVKSSVLASGGPKITASKIKVSDIPKPKLGKQPLFKAPKIPKPLKVKPENLLSKLSKWDGTFTDRMHTMSFTSSAAQRRMAAEPVSPKVDKPVPKISKPAPTADKPVSKISKPTPKVDKPVPQISKPAPTADKPTSAPKISKPTSVPKADKPTVKPTVKPVPEVDKSAPEPKKGAGDHIVKMINALQESFASLSSRVDVIMNVLTKATKTQHDQGQQLQNLQNSQIQSQTIQSQQLQNLQKEQNERFLGLQNSQIQSQTIQTEQLQKLQTNQIESQTIQSEQLQRLQINQIESQKEQNERFVSLQNNQIASQKEQNERFLGLQNSQIKTQRDNNIKIRRIQSNTSILRETQETIINNQTQQNEAITSLNETTGEIVNNQQQAHQATQEVDGNQPSTVDPATITELQEKTNNIIQSQSEIKESLEETTTILNDIGNAMSLDFADRIQKERNLLQKARKKKLDAKRKAAEESVEGSGKAAEKRGKDVADKTQKPVMGLLDRLKKLFTVLLIGFITSGPIKWLRKNAWAIDGFFKFFSRHWLTILGFGFGTYISETAKNLARGWKNLGKNNWLRKGLRGARNKLFGAKVTKTGMRAVKGGVTDAAFGIKSKSVAQFKRVKGPVGKVLQKSNIAAKKIKKLPIPRGAGGVLSVLFAGMEFKGRLDEGQSTGKALLGTAGSTLGGMAGATKGAAIGAAIGSVIPGAGTAIGAVLGGLIGGIGGAMLGGKAADMVSDTVGLGGNTKLDKNVSQTGKLEEEDANRVIINDLIKDQSGGITPLDTPIGGSSLPMLSPEDASNPYVAKMKEELGVMT